jgi:hypothetical protein
MLYGESVVKRLRATEKIGRFSAVVFFQPVLLSVSSRHSTTLRCSAAAGLRLSGQSRASERLCEALQVRACRPSAHPFPDMA